MASVDNVGWDCRGFFMMVLQGGLGKICGKVEGTIHDNLFKQIIHTHTHIIFSPQMHGQPQSGQFLVKGPIH